MPDEFGEKITRGDTVYGTFVAIPEPAIVEMLGWAGYDFAVVDFEHSGVDMRTVRDMVRAAETSGVTPLARIGHREFALALPLVEQGIRGILAPHVTSAEYLRTLIDTVRYRDAGGDRGIDPSTRAVRYGLVSMADRITVDRSDVLIFALVEDAEGIEALDEIAAVPGLDGVMLGAADLARSYGHGADVAHPHVQDVIAEATAVVLAADVAVWRVAYDAPEVAHIRDGGASIISTPAVDSLLIARTFADHLAAVRRAVSPA